MSHRPRIVDKQMKKLEYLMHVKRLEQLSSDKNHFQKSVRKQRQEINSLIKQSHKIHLNSLRSLSKVKNFSQTNTQRNNYQKVKSVIKVELDRRILTVPFKQKLDQFDRQMNNIKLVNKILNVKSQFDFKQQAIQNISKRVTKRRLDKSQDYSRLYEKIFNNYLKQKKIRLFLTKDKQNVRLVVKILDQQNIFQIKSSNPYIIVIQNAKQQKQSKQYSLDQLSISQFIFQVPPIQCQISFVQLITQKRIARFRLTICQNDFIQLKAKGLNKEIQDIKQKVIGLASIQLKNKRSKKETKLNNNPINFKQLQQQANNNKKFTIQNAQTHQCVL